MNATQIREHMDVVGSDGEHVGTVDRVQGDTIKLTRNDPAAQGQHHEIPLAWVSDVQGDTARLNIPAAQAQQQWQAVG